MEISDDEWFELQFNQEGALSKFGIILPKLPSDDVQDGFTAMHGRDNLNQAFEFYRYVCSVSHLAEINKPRMLDFGGGWGRISRFFLKDTDPEHIYIVDTMAFAIDCLHATGNPCRIIHNQPLPPIQGLNEKFDLVYSYSVFSHLSENYFRVWVDYLLGVLRPGGYLAFTTRGHFFINHLEELHKAKTEPPKTLKEHIRRLREEMPTPEEIRRRYLTGLFQFYPIGGAGELTSNFFGETFIPKAYIERHFGSLLVQFTEDVPRVDQSVILLRKPK
jgi:SAM-dependent methyltransferase